MLSEPTGTAQKCHDLLASAGFEEVEVKAEQYGGYISLDRAKQMWTGTSHPTPGQFPNPLVQLSAEQLEQARAEYNAQLEALVTDRGIWNDITIFFTFGRKPAASIS
jgi:hypothetical protein